MVGLVSDVGLKRSLNQDYASYLENEHFKLYIVADGMGGHNAGEVASQMAVEEILNYVEDKYYIEKRENLIVKAIENANKTIFEFSKSNEKLRGMGTTVTACLMTDTFLQIANVGDSSCLGIKNGELKKITKDHSLVQELLDSGSITEEDAINHPKKNIITRALGTSSTVMVDVFPINNNEYDKYILCSDGLTNEVTYEEIMDIIKKNTDYNDIANELVELAKEKGGRDNITVLLFGGEM